ncbi:MAG: hypothetical protein HQM08_30565 [Candidatus Riflebacteria bacterium]|nr:hypothetical protein [Candidatus Riflebacteria bacterium]
MLRIKAPIDDLIRFLLLHEIRKQLKECVEHDMVLNPTALLQSMYFQDFHLVISF